MARPCLTKLRTRVVQAMPHVPGDATPDWTNAQSMLVTEVEIETVGETIDRSDLYTPTGQGGASITTARKMNFNITQETYLNFEQHRLFIEACPVNVTGAPGGEVLKASTSTCSGDGFKPIDVRIVEVGGNQYVSRNVTGLFNLSASPGDRVMLAFEFSGQFVIPEDAPVTVPPMANLRMPVLYKNSTFAYADTQNNPLDMVSCGAIEFGPGMESVNIASACTPDGGGWQYVAATTAATLTMSGVVSTQESKQHLWELATDPSDNTQLYELTIYKDAAGNELKLTLDESRIQDPSVVDLEGFVGYDLNVESSTWSLAWTSVADTPSFNPVTHGPGVAYDFTDPSRMATGPEGTGGAPLDGEEVQSVQDLVSGQWVDFEPGGDLGDQYPTYSDTGALYLYSGNDINIVNAPEVPGRPVFVGASSYDLGGVSILTIRAGHSSSSNGYIRYVLNNDSGTFGLVATVRSSTSNQEYLSPTVQTPITGDGSSTVLLGVDASPLADNQMVIWRTEAGDVKAPLQKQLANPVVGPNGWFLGIEIYSGNESGTVRAVRRAYATTTPLTAEDVPLLIAWLEG